jgi:mono/diheme cytochrome c family protein
VKNLRKVGLALAAILVSTLMVAGLVSADEGGKALFASKGCAACHGPNAEGKVGPALAGHTEEEIVKTVRSGKGAMPAFSTAQLSDAELQEIVEFIEGLKVTGPPDEHHLKETLEALEANNLDKAKEEMTEAIEKASADRKAQEQAILADLKAGKTKEAEAGIRKLLGEAEAEHEAAPTPAALPDTGDPLTGNLLLLGGLGGLALLGGGLLLRRQAR